MGLGDYSELRCCCLDERKSAQDRLTFSRRPELSFPLLIFLFLNTLIQSRISASPLSFLATAILLLCLWGEGSQ